MVDMEFADLYYAFVHGLEIWLNMVKNFNHNTTIKFIACVRKIIRLSIGSGWIQWNPFTGFDMSLKEGHPDILTKEKLRVLAATRDDIPQHFSNIVEGEMLKQIAEGLRRIKHLFRGQVERNVFGDAPAI